MNTQSHLKVYTDRVKYLGLDYIFKFLYIINLDHFYERVKNKMQYIILKEYKFINKTFI